MFNKWWQTRFLWGCPVSCFAGSYKSSTGQRSCFTALVFIPKLPLTDLLWPDVQAIVSAQHCMPVTVFPIYLFIYSAINHREVLTSISQIRKSGGEKWVCESMYKILSTILKGCKGCKGGNEPVPGTTAVKALCGASGWQSLPPTVKDEYYFPSLITTIEWAHIIQFWSRGPWEQC